jgi:hypothetical protein
VLSLFLEATEKRQDGKIPWWVSMLFLANAVTVVSGMKSFVVAWFGGTACRWDWGNRSEVFTERSDGLDGQGSCCFYTVGNNGLPDADPILKVVDIGLFNVCIERGGGRGEKEISVSVKYGIAFVV